MKIGLIGLGDIAQKAYLPVMAKKSDIELVLCTRNNETLDKLSKKYRIYNCVSSVEELINTGVEAVFIHSSTEVHVEIAEKLLNNGIHVYVDKPMAYSFSEAERLVNLSEVKNKLLMVGFNRRFAPMYKELKKQSGINLIVMQKNRTFSPDNARRYIFDDFIHVVDTLRFLLPGDIENINVHPLIKDGKLYSITLLLAGKGYTAIGIMNRDSGITEETLEVINPGNKWVVKDLAETTCYSKGEQRLARFKDWDPTLFKRGFYDIVDNFIDCVEKRTESYPTARDSLVTHEICERIVAAIEGI